MNLYKMRGSGIARTTTIILLLKYEIQLNSLQKKERNETEKAKAKNQNLEHLDKLV